MANSRLGTALLTAAVAGSLGFAAVTNAGPAQAISAPLNYTCAESTLGSTTYVVTVDTDLPTTAPPNNALGYVVTSAITIPGSVIDTIKAEVDGGGTINGSSSAKLKVNSGTPTTSTLDFPATALPAAAGAALAITASGVGSQQLPPAPAGTLYALAAGNFVLELYALSADESLLAYFEISCTLTSANPSIDTVTISSGAPTPTYTPTPTPTPSADPTEWPTDLPEEEEPSDGTSTEPTGTPTANPTPGPAVGTRSRVDAVYKAGMRRAIVKTRVRTTHGVGVTGQVKVVLKRNGRLVKKAKVTLTKQSLAKVVFKRLEKRGDYVVVATYLGSPTALKSRAKPVTFTVG